jgi:hypothetical protein
MSVAIVITGNVNIRLDRPTDPDACQLTSLLAVRGMSRRITAPTHVKNGRPDGLLGVVVTHNEHSVPPVVLLDFELSAFPSPLADVVCSPAASLHNVCPPTVARCRRRCPGWCYTNIISWSTGRATTRDQR